MYITKLEALRHYSVTVINGETLSLPNIKAVSPVTGRDGSPTHEKFTERESPRARSRLPGRQGE